MSRTCSSNISRRTRSTPAAEAGAWAASRSPAPRSDARGNRLDCPTSNGSVPGSGRFRCRCRTIRCATSSSTCSSWTAGSRSSTPAGAPRRPGRRSSPGWRSPDTPRLTCRRSSSPTSTPITTGSPGGLREASGAWVALHPADAALIPARYGRGLERLLASMDALLVDAGVPDEIASRAHRRVDGHSRVRRRRRARCPARGPRAGAAARLGPRHAAHPRPLAGPRLLPRPPRPRCSSAATTSSHGSARASPSTCSSRSTRWRTSSTRCAAFATSTSTRCCPRTNGDSAGSMRASTSSSITTAAGSTRPMTAISAAPRGSPAGRPRSGCAGRGTGRRSSASCAARPWARRSRTWCSSRASGGCVATTPARSTGTRRTPSDR